MIKKVIDERILLVAVLGVVFDSIAIFIATKLGFPRWACVLIGFIPSMAGANVINALVESMIRISMMKTCVGLFFFLALSAGLLQRYAGVEVWTNLPYYVAPAVLIAVISAIVTRIKIKKQAKKVIETFEQNNGEIAIDSKIAKEVVSTLLGENRPIEGGYDEANAVRCENGIFVGKCLDGVRSFLGIPYALPPIGPNRWKAPRAVNLSDRVFEAYYYGKTPLQPKSDYTVACLFPMDEDCLTLNIWKSAEADEKCAVLVGFDTFDWCVGGTASPVSDGMELVKENPKIIYVNVNFRLGLFGNMDFSGIPGGEEYADSYNLGLRDQIEALRWIHRNIASFGGDPENITLIGFAAGAVGVDLMPLIPETKGLFQKVISLGGSVYGTIDLNAFKSYQREIREYFHAETMADFLALSQRQLAEAIKEIESWEAALPVRDGKYVPLDIKAAYAAGAASDISLLVSVSKQDGISAFAVEDGAENVVQKYRNHYDRIYENLSAAQKECLEKYIHHYCESEPSTREKSGILLTDLFFHFPMLSLCQAQTKAGGVCRYLFWNIKSPVKTIGANFIVAGIVLLGETKYSEDCGVVGDPLVFKAVRRMFANFVLSGDPSLKYGELANAVGVKWQPLSETDGAVMTINEFSHELDDGELSRKMSKLEALDRVLFCYNWPEEK